jgi:hypothetical protein
LTGDDVLTMTGDDDDAQTLAFLLLLKQQKIFVFDFIP